MRKLVLATILFLIALQSRVNAQNPTIKPLQYSVLIERTVKHRADYQCYKWERGSSGVGCITEPYFLYGGGPNNPYYGACMVVDPTCSSMADGYDKVKIRIFKNNNLSNFKLY